MINEEGFLSSDIDSIISANETELKIIVEFYKKINVFCQKTLFEIKIERQNTHHWCLASLYLRALSTYQSIYLLSIRGLNSESKILLRTLIEIQYITTAIEKNHLLALDYLGQEAVEIQKILKIAKGYPQSFGDKLDIKEIEEKIKSLDIEKTKHNTKQVSIKQFAEKAGLAENYDTYYKFLCLASHANMADVREHLVFNGDGIVSTFSWGPNKKQIPQVLLSATETILKTVYSLCISFGLDKESDFKQFNSEFTRVRKQIK